MQSCPIVIDTGSFSVKVGRAGEMKSSHSFQPVVGRVKQPSNRGKRKAKLVRNPAPEGRDYCVGDEVFEHHGKLLPKFAIKRGMIDNWEDIEKIWTYTYHEILDISSEDQGVLVTEPPMNMPSSRNRTCQIFFETLSVPKMLIANQALLSLFSYGRGTGLVVEVGHGCVYAVPVFDGYALNHAAAKMQLGGNDVTEHFMKLLNKRLGVDMFYSVWDREIIRQQKDVFSSITLDYDSKNYTTYNNNDHATQNSPSKSISKNDLKKNRFELPDGTLIEFDNECNEACELLFHPLSIIGKEHPGLSSLVYDLCVRKCDIDVRAALMRGICLGGGGSCIPGLSDRLEKEVKALAPSAAKIKVVARPERRESAWIGGSIISTLSTFSQVWVTKAEWDECGENVIAKRRL